MGEEGTEVVGGEGDDGRHPSLVAKSQPLTIHQAARALMRDFPDWLCWYGTVTEA